MDWKMSQTTQTDIKQSATKKLADFVHNKIDPELKKFINDLTNQEITWLLKNFGSMRIDIKNDLTKEANKRNMDTASWRSSSPLDDILKENH